jgi:hypothetical protein
VFTSQRQASCCSRSLWNLAGSFLPLTPDSASFANRQYVYEETRARAPISDVTWVELPNSTANLFKTPANNLFIVRVRWGLNTSVPRPGLAYCTSVEWNRGKWDTWRDGKMADWPGIEWDLRSEKPATLRLSLDTGLRSSSSSSSSSNNNNKLSLKTQPHRQNTKWTLKVKFPLCLSDYHAMKTSHL